MKLCQAVDNLIDQNEIESIYLWDSDLFSEIESMNRINLSTRSIDFSTPNDYRISICITLPNNQDFGIMNKDRNEALSYLFIFDDYYNIKFIEILKGLCLSFISCYYDDSIFIFAKYRYKKGAMPPIAKRYIISQNRWITLANSPCEYPVSCIGYNQKIVIYDERRRLWIYDIILDNYTYHLPIINLDWKPQSLIKISGKLFMRIQSIWNDYIFVCEDPFLDWKLYRNITGVTCDKISEAHAYYEGAIYYLSSQILYKFSLLDFKTTLLKYIY